MEMFLEHFHDRVLDPVHRLDPEIMQRVVVWQVAVIAGGPHPLRVVASVHVFPVGAGNRFVGVATGAELIVGCGVKGGIQDRPAGNRSDAETCENHKSKENSIAKEAL